MKITLRITKWEKRVGGTVKTPKICDFELVKIMLIIYGLETEVE